MNEAEELVTCPYNKAHSILKGRMQFHLARCRAQHNLTEKVCCPYNSTHVIPKLELDYHQQNCKSRIVLDSFVYQMGNSACPAKDTVPINNLDLPPCEENWDDDGVEQSVLDIVKEKAKDKGVLLNLIGAPKAERKAHRYKERLRFQRVTEGLPAQSGTGNRPETEHKSKKKSGGPKSTFENVKDVRLPRGRGTLLQEPARDSFPKMSNKGKGQDSKKGNNIIYENTTEKNNGKTGRMKLVSSSNRERDMSDTSDEAGATSKSDRMTGSESENDNGWTAPRASRRSNRNAQKKHAASNCAAQTNGHFPSKQNVVWMTTPASFAAAAAMNSTQKKWSKNQGYAWGQMTNDENKMANISDFPSLPISGRGRGKYRYGN